jgi:hypothetical protein
MPDLPETGGELVLVQQLPGRLEKVILADAASGLLRKLRLPAQNCPQVQACTGHWWKYAGKPQHFHV